MLVIGSFFPVTDLANDMASRLQRYTQMNI